MESYEDQKLDEEKMAEELMAIKEELHRAKDNAMQSWLDSKPLIDELEKLQAGITNAKNRISLSNTVILELESQLEATEVGIRTKTEEQAKAKEMIDEMNRVLDQKYEESQEIKLDIYGERRAKSKLKQVLRVRRQTLQTFHLTLQAFTIELEAFEASKNEAIEYMKISETENSVVGIGECEFYALRRRAKEETGLAKRRIFESVEQKLEAEETRNFAFSRLKEIRRRRRSKEETVNEETIMSEEIAEEQSSVRVEEEVINGNGFPEGRAEVIAKSNSRKLPKEMIRRTRSKKKKVSIFRRIRRFLCFKFR